GNTSKFSYNDAESINRIDLIDVACEEYSQEVLGFSDNSESDNPTPISKPIIAKSSPSLTPFEGGDFILEETEGYLASDSVLPGIDYEDISEFFSTFPIPVPLNLRLLDLILKRRIVAVPLIMLMFLFQSMNDSIWREIFVSSRNS
ncbi:hypothetical protein Tco_1367059, partial [Tanacetum coccineum]